MTGAEQEKSPQEAISYVDQVWTAYMARPRDLSDFTQLLQPDFQPEYQQRAIQTLLAPNLAPHLKILPFPVNVEDGTTIFVESATDWIHGVSDEQALYIANLLPEYIEKAKNLGIVFEREAISALSTYNRLIPRLLSRLPQEEAERLFENYDINYGHLGARFFIHQYRRLSDWPPKYIPLRDLYYEEIDEPWKRKAAAQVHQEVEKEENSEIQFGPSDKHIRLNTYRSVLMDLLNDEKGLPISREFYQDEIAYIMSVVSEDEPAFDQGLQTGEGRILDILEEPLKHQFVRRQVLPKTRDGVEPAIRSFVIYNESDASIATRIISEYPDDKDLVGYLTEQLVDSQNLREEQKRKNEQASRYETDIITLMKQPAKGTSQLEIPTLETEKTLESETSEL